MNVGAPLMIRAELNREPHQAINLDTLAPLALPVHFKIATTFLPARFPAQIDVRMRTNGTKEETREATNDGTQDTESFQATAR